MIDFELQLPLTYYLAAAILAFGVLHGLLSLRRSWAPGYLAVLGTIGAWYFIEPLYLPQGFIYFSEGTLELGFFSVCIFLISFMVLAPPMIGAFRPRIPRHLRQPATGWADGLNVEKVVYLVTGVWLVLLAYGTMRMGGDLFGALFPIDGRAGGRMWSRAAGAGAGATGFIVSTASYLYTLCLAAFGLLLPLARKPETRALLVLLILISWPYAFLQGSRNIALAVIAPFFASYFLYSRASVATKGAFLAAGFLAVEFAMRMVIAFRNVGFRDVDLAAVNETKHLGLNMASELMYVTTFVQTGVMQISYGGQYLTELANVIPRAIWPGKPLIGIDYAIARGFADGGVSDIGVFATISTGMIGQGVLNFGSFVGPAFVGFLMACWVGILNRMRTYGGLPRTGLFLVGLGLTFNLGRDITLLVLFPFVFGYAAVLFLDQFDRRRKGRKKIGPASAEKKPPTSSLNVSRPLSPR